MICDIILKSILKVHRKANLISGPDYKGSIKSHLFRSIAMTKIGSDKNYEENQVAAQIFRKSKVSVMLTFQYSLKQKKAKGASF